MREIPDDQLDIWTGGDFTGDNRPIARVTIQRLHVNLTKVDPKRLFASSIFGQADRPRELPNVKAVTWERSITSDVATCTVTFYNTAPLRLGEQPDISGDLDHRGYYTFNYGANDWSVERWGQTPNRWQDYLVPDRLLRTYEGYGWDASQPPETDPHLTQTGMWLIDTVEYTSDGLITITCRDVGRLLLDHICFPPVIPLANYPLQFVLEHDVANNTKDTLGGLYRPTYQTDSNVPYVGRGGAVHGHYGRHAFDSSSKTYWLSIGNGQPHAGYSYEYIQGDTDGKTVAAVKYRVWGGPYRVYLSIKVGGKWLGRSVVPYDRSNPVSAPNGADIHYVASQTVDREGTGTFGFKTPYKNVQAVRLCFTDLYNSGIGPFRYRSGVRDFACFTSYKKGGAPGKHKEGDYKDYSEVVKYLLACGGFYWPKNSSAFFTHSDGTKHQLQPAKNDPYLVKGRIWGDILMSGVGQAGTADGTAKLDVDVFDKKPLMDGISFIRDILGFLFFIEETGGAVFRLANIYQVGNFVGNDASDAGYKKGLVDADTGKPNVLTIDEKQTLIGLTAKLSSENIRESIFIANTDGKIGAVAFGYNPVTPNPALRRVGGWTDQNFENVQECQRMADMIVVRQALEYRTDQLTIVATPAIQIDDQVRIYERTTGEGSIHYVKSISSNNDLESGRWTYGLSTHWLGEVPFSRWAFDPAKLNNTTNTFLKALKAY